MVFKSNIRYEIASLIEPLHSFKQTMELDIIWAEFNLESQVHNKEYMLPYIYTLCLPIFPTIKDSELPWQKGP